MAYLVQDDYTISIAIGDLTEILTQAAASSGLTTANVLDNAYLTAEAEAKAHLSPIYDMATELAKTGATRDRMLMKILVDITLYNIHFTVNPRDIPELRERAYQRALEVLRNFRDGVLVPSQIPRKDQAGIAGAGRTEIYSNRRFISKPFDDPSLLNPEQQNPPA